MNAKRMKHARLWAKRYVSLLDDDWKRVYRRIKKGMRYTRRFGSHGG